MARSIFDAVSDTISVLLLKYAQPFRRFIDGVGKFYGNEKVDRHGSGTGTGFVPEFDDEPRGPSARSLHRATTKSHVDLDRRSAESVN